jgi:hypothetical protein
MGASALIMRVTRPSHLRLKYQELKKLEMSGLLKIRIEEIKRSIKGVYMCAGKSTE